jgi:hypothetical protein
MASVFGTMGILFIIWFTFILCLLDAMVLNSLTWKFYYSTPYLDAAIFAAQTEYVYTSL